MNSVGARVRCGESKFHGKIFRTCERTCTRARAGGRAGRRRRRRVGGGGGGGGGGSLRF